MTEELISVIIPCYQNGQTIEKAIRSVLDQRDVSVEIVCVNDGSTDNTGEVLARLQQTDARIRVRNQANGGVGSARNAGIELATGAWLFFLDGDDYLEPDALRILMAGVRQDPDVEICCGAYEIRHLESNETERHTCTDGDRQVIYESLIRGDSALNSMCARLYRTALIRSNHIRVPEQVRVGEDVLFNLEAFRVAKAWRMLGDVIYRYELGGDSAMMRARESQYEASRPMIEGILAFTQRNHLETSLFRAVIDIYVRTLRVAYGRFGAALRLRRSEVREMSAGVECALLPAKQQVYFYALHIWPFLSILLP